MDVSLLWRPYDRLTMNLNLVYSNRDGWLLYRGDRQFNTYYAKSWSPRVSTIYFISTKQNLRFDLEWRSIKAAQNNRYELPEGETRLGVVPTDQQLSVDSFAISRLNLQLRYRWEIAHMSDVFIVYTISSDLPDSEYRSFSDQFVDTFENPVAEGLILKIRHRLGT